MPKLSFFNAIFREPWMIDPMTAAAQKQVLQGVLMGLAFTQEDGEQPKPIGHKDAPVVPQGRKVSVVSLTGTMFRDDLECGPLGTRTLARQLREADADAKTIGHILYIDSGGGAANSVPDLAEAITDCQKPVVAFVDGYMCSAAMYVGSYCNHIIANRGDNRVGCIGTVVEMADWPKQAKEQDGMVHLRVYADGSEDKNGEYEAALEGDFKLIKERVLNPLNEQFKTDIRNNRRSVTDDQLTGRTYFARETVGTLIDAIGDFDSAVAKVVELSNLNITQMNGFEHLQSLDSCNDLQMVDGTVTLTEEQLQQVEAALAEGQTEKALQETNKKTIDSQAETIAEQLTNINELTAERDELKTKADQLDAKDAQIAALTQERDSLKEEVAQKDDRIEELEAAIENDEIELKTIVHNGNPAKPDEEWKEPTDEESAEYCRKVQNGEI